MTQLWEERALNTATGDSNSRQTREVLVSDLESRGKKATIFFVSLIQMWFTIAKNPLASSFSNLHSTF